MDPTREESRKCRNPQGSLRWVGALAPFRNQGAFAKFMNTVMSLFLLKAWFNSPKDVSTLELNELYFQGVYWTDEFLTPQCLKSKHQRAD